ncbi:MAG: nucleoside hydrolase [Anaerolineae bacterium]|nr:nucleoside hydrolase [Anaerolineae bacterium]
MAQKIILDVDTGNDDAVAILMAGHHPAIELVAVTVTHGNAVHAVTLPNTLKAVSAGNLAHVPVYPGAVVALTEDPKPSSGLNGRVLDLPEPTVRPQQQHAVDFLREYYHGPDGPQTIYVPVGPLTNLALALRLDPGLARRIPRIVTMGGAYRGGGRNPAAEFNILADPEGARVVYNAGIPILMVGLEVTEQALVTPADVERLKAIDTPQARVAAAVMLDEILWMIQEYGWDGGQIFDACAVAEIIEPGLVSTTPMWVDIEVNGSLTRGRTVADISGRTGRTSNVDVGIGIDRARFVEIMIEALSVIRQPTIRPHTA